MLPNATQDQIVATGFLRNSMLNEEGGVDPEQFRMDAMFDRMDALGKSVLGLTIACAQCHNHKYDPLTQEEYYRLFAYLNNDHEAQRVVYTPDEQQKIAGVRRMIGEIEGKLRHTSPDWQERMAKWEESLPAQPNWEVIRVTNQGDNSQRYIEQKDGSILCQGYAPTKFSTHMRGETKLKTIAGFRLELLNDPNLPCNGSRLVVHGHLCPERVQRGRLGREGPEEEDHGQVRPGDRGLRQPGAASSSRTFDDKSKKKPA